MGDPRKHHYVPEMVLKRFADRNGQLSKFNKEHNKLSRQRFHPGAVGYELDLHTLVLGDLSTTKLEELFSHLETQFSTFFKSIDDASTQGILAEAERIPEFARLQAYFLTVSFWRTPGRGADARRARTGLRKIYDAAPKSAREEFPFPRLFLRDLERRGGIAREKLTQFLALPAILYAFQNEDLARCQIVNVDFDLAISDAPVICDLDENFLMHGDIYMPIGTRQCITNAPQRITAFQQRVFDDAKRFVVSHDDVVLLRLSGMSNASPAI